MRIDVLTLFPAILEGFLAHGLLRLARAKALVDVHQHDFREFTTYRHRSVDDKPYGGGPGMVLMCGPVFDCDAAVVAAGNRAGLPGEPRRIMLTPQGRRLDQGLLEELAQERWLSLLCGHYEGFDERIRLGLQPLEVSAGDFIANGGEVPAMLLIDTVIRLIPGVLGDETSHKYDSFSESGLLQYPQYTRPRDFRGMAVPELLVGGNHEEIAEWRKNESLNRTRERREDLME